MNDDFYIVLSNGTNFDIIIINIQKFFESIFLLRSSYYIIIITYWGIIINNNNRILRIEYHSKWNDSLFSRFFKKIYKYETFIHDQKKFEDVLTQERILSTIYYR